MSVLTRVCSVPRLVTIVAAALLGLTSLVMSSPAFAYPSPGPQVVPPANCLYANVVNPDPGGLYDNAFPILIRQGNGCSTANSGATPPFGLRYKVSNSCPGIGDPVRYGSVPFAPMQPNGKRALNAVVQGHCILCDVVRHQVVGFPPFTLTITLLGIDGVYATGLSGIAQSLGMSTDPHLNPVLAQGVMLNGAFDPGTLVC